VEEARVEMLAGLGGLTGRRSTGDSPRSARGERVDRWFTFLTASGMESTNNRVGRALWELVVRRKISGGFRNGKGIVISETVMSVLAT
jgi:hypothetical protein